MEFLTSNYIDTITSITYDSNTITVSNIIDPDLTFQYVSQGYSDDSLTTSLTFTLDATTSVDRIYLKEMNFKEFSVFYNGSTANTLNLSEGITTTSNWTNNEDEHLYLKFDTITCNSITLDITKTIIPNKEKAIGYFSINKLKLNFPQIPSAKGYKPTIEPEETVHKMSDGGSRLHFLKEKWSAKIQLQNITKDFRDDLKDVWSDHANFDFIAFETNTSWDGVSFNVIWPGKFDFYTYSDSAVDSGFTGSITLKET